MTSRIVRALNARNALPAAGDRIPFPRHQMCQPARRNLPIRAALEWAFGLEHAGLDFAEGQGDNTRPAVSPVWVVMQRGVLGCSIDGGGHSLPARDADIIASEVANLPAALGGARMAVQLAELARMGQVPDWGRHLTPRCIPKAWKHENQNGPQAATDLVEVVTLGQAGRTREFRVYCCPVTYTASATRIAAARAQYLAWIEALAWLACQLRGKSVLDRVAITDGLPEMEPWVDVVRAREVA